MQTQAQTPQTPQTPQTRDFPFAEPQFETLRDADSIDNQAITALAQDSRGLIWIGTQDGLVRYDGYRYRKFSHSLANPASLAGDYVQSLYAAKDGRIWVGTNSDGLSVFDPASERFTHFRHDNTQPDSIGGGRISAIVGDEHGAIWLATDEGLDYLAPGSLHFVHFQHSNQADSLLSNKVRSLLLDQTGRLWVGSGAGLQRLAKNGKQFETILSGRDVLTLFQARDGKLWLGTGEHGAAWLLPEPAQAAPMVLHWLPLAQLSHPWVGGIAQVEPEQIWLATLGGGIQIVSASDGQVRQTLRHDAALPASLALDSVKPLLLDQSGWLWVGTWGAGLQRVNSNNRMLRLLRHSPRQSNWLSHPDIRSILELPNGQLLLGSKGNGIDIIDRQRGLVGGYRKSSIAGQPGALPDATVYALAQTADGAIWAGTQQAGLLRQSAGSQDWLAIAGLPGSLVRKLLVGQAGDLWIGTNRGIAHCLPDNTAQPCRIKTFTTAQGKPMQNPVVALAQDPQGRLWIGTANGLWLKQADRPELIRIAAEPKRPGGLISDYIVGLLPDRDGRLWISTDKGLLRLTSWDGKQALFEDISSLVGQAGKAIGGNIQQDRAGRIWTKEIMLDPQRMQMRPISRVDGMDIGASWLGSYAQTRDGLLLYGGAQGLAIIDPARLANYDYAPALVITELKINGQVQAPGSLLQPGSKLTLSPQQRTITLEFAALDLAEPRKNRYQYRLQGYDKEWIEADADHRSANYGNLWPGRYTLQIRGSNRMGVFSKQELALHLQVLPAWWQSIWFGLLLLLALLGLIVALVQLRTRYLRQRQLLLEQQVQAATRELRQKQSELVAANASLSLSVDTLRLLGDIGREITANLEADIVFQSLYLYVGGLLNAPTMTIYRINSAGTLLEAVFGREGEQPMQMRNIALDSPTSTAARVVRERQELLLNFDKLDDANHIPGTRKMHSALFAPLIVGEQVLGVMSIQSDQIHAYGERECLIFRTLCAYGAIAMANATAIAALREAQAQLVQKEKMASLGGLVAGIAHEINTPLGTTLTAISGTADAWHTLQDASSSGRLNKSILSASTKEGIEYCELALHAATRAAELIKVFKSISVQAGNDYPVQVKLAEYLPEVLALLQTPLDQSGCQLQLEVGPDLSLRVVPEALTEALTRILVNVFDHAFDDGRQGSLLITADVLDAEWALISISDNGVGIAPADLPKVFDPFFTTKSGIQHHVGLGLHVAYNQITQRLGGKISISSQLGQGTRVEIRLPRT